MPQITSYIFKCILLLYVYVHNVGQFLTADVKFDADNMLMQLGDRKPLSVKKDKAWPFLGINEECWYGANTDNQGTGIIEGIYIDYVVEDLIQK